MIRSKRGRQTPVTSGSKTEATKHNESHLCAIFDNKKGSDAAARRDRSHNDGKNAPECDPSHAESTMGSHRCQGPAEDSLKPSDNPWLNALLESCDYLETIYGADVDRCSQAVLESRSSVFRDHYGAAAQRAQAQLDAVRRFRRDLESQFSSESEFRVVRIPITQAQSHDRATGGSQTPGVRLLLGRFRSRWNALVVRWMGGL